MKHLFAVHASFGHVLPAIRLAELMVARGKDREQLQLRLIQLEQRLAAQNKKLFGESSEKRADGQGKDGNERVQYKQHSDAPKAIRQVAANGAHEAPGKEAGRPARETCRRAQEGR